MIAEELIPQDAADHQVVGAAQQRRNDKLSHRRNEHQHGAGDDAGNGLRHGDIQEGPPRRTSQVGGGFQQGVVQFLERGEQGQHHEGQVRVDDAQVHGNARAHDLQRLRDQSQFQQHRVENSAVADDAFECINAQQERGPEGQNDDQQQDALRGL